MAEINSTNTRLYIEVPEELKEQVSKIAKERGESLSTIARLAIREFCNENSTDDEVKHNA